jgi:hypothetical protein
MIDQEHADPNRRMLTAPSRDDPGDNPRSFVPTFIAIALWTMIFLAGLS